VLPVFKNLCCLRVNTLSLRREEKVCKEIFLFIVRTTRNTNIYGVRHVQLLRVRNRSNWSY